jgi:hypothetical protein
MKPNQIAGLGKSLFKLSLLRSVGVSLLLLVAIGFFAYLFTSRPDELRKPAIIE